LQILNNNNNSTMTSKAMSLVAYMEQVCTQHRKRCTMAIKGTILLYKNRCKDTRSFSNKVTCNQQRELTFREAKLHLNLGIQGQCKEFYLEGCPM
jgi:hypothetical protein